jgi:prefoldin subunit 5
MEEMTRYMLEFGALGAFCAFLIWSHVKAEKRMDKAVEAFQGQINQITARSDQRENELRDRYDMVIKKQDESKEKILIDVVARLTAQESKLDECIVSLNSGLGSLREELTELKIRAAQSGV